MTELPQSLANQLAQERTLLAQERNDLAQERTSLAFERTRMAKDRTMFAMLRTALSMVGFGFTIFAFFRTLMGQDLLGGAVRSGAPARFGLSLVTLGLLVLVYGIWFDRATMKRLDADRAALVASGRLPEVVRMPQSSLQYIALLLLLIALFAILSIAMRVGPYA